MPFPHSPKWHNPCFHGVLKVVPKLIAYIMRTFWPVLRVGMALTIMVFNMMVTLPLQAAKTEPVKFDLLKVGTRTYTNVTVTFTGKNSVFLIHSGGMETVALTNLQANVLVQLGYGDPGSAGTNTVMGWVKGHVPVMAVTNLDTFRKYLPAELDRRLPTTLDYDRLLEPKVLTFMVLFFLMFHLVFSFAASRICRVALGFESDLIWIPVAQFVPLFKAAGMSPWWGVGLLVPVFNVVPMVLWCFRIAKILGKSPVFGVLLLIPPVNVFVMLHLAFRGLSEPRPKDPASRKIQIRTLPTT